MTDGPRAGPPQKRECRPGQEAASLGETGKVNSVDNATNSMALSSKIHATAAPISILEPRKLAAGIGIPVLSPYCLKELVTPPAWIAVEFSLDEHGEDVFYCSLDTGIRLGIRLATNVLAAPDLEQVCRLAARLAANGGRVMVIERPVGAPCPGGDGA